MKLAIKGIRTHKLFWPSNNTHLQLQKSPHREGRDEDLDNRGFFASNSSSLTCDYIACIICKNFSLIWSSVRMQNRVMPYLEQFVGSNPLKVAHIQNQVMNRASIYWQFIYIYCLFIETHWNKVRWATLFKSRPAVSKITMSKKYEAFYMLVHALLVPD